MPLYKHPYKGKYKDYIATWGNDRDCEEYEVEVENWLNQFDEEQTPFVLDLLKKFHMYRGHYYELCIKELFKKYTDYNEAWSKDSYFFEVKKKDNVVNNSDEFFLDFWRINEIKPFCKTDIDTTLKENPKLRQIVIVDDFAGTGKTIKDYLNKIKNSCPAVQNKEIVLLLLACTKWAEHELRDFSYREKLDVKIIYVKSQDKAFIADLNTTTFNAEKNKNYYLSICNNFGLNYPLGFEETEALIAFKHNTPNNTLGIFWEEFIDTDGKCFVGLRTRKTYDRTKQHPVFRNSKKNKRFKRESILDNESYLYAIFAYACICSKKKFDKSRIEKVLGLNNKQFFVRLDLCLINGYLKNEKGTFVEGGKLTVLSVAFRKKIKDYVRSLLNESQISENVSGNDSVFHVDAKYVCKKFI